MTTRRKRRGKSEVCALILAAAREMFIEHGYEGTSTRAIAQRADVLEVVIYSNFSSKAQLFDAAIISPALSALRGHVERWLSTEDDPPDPRRTLGCLAELYDTCYDNRGVLGAVLAAQAHDADLASRLRRAVRDLIVTVSLTGADGVTIQRPPRAIEVTVGAVFAAAVHGELFFAPRTGEIRAAVLDYLESQPGIAVPIAATQEDNGGARNGAATQ